MNSKYFIKKGRRIFYLDYHKNIYLLLSPWLGTLCCGLVGPGKSSIGHGTDVYQIYIFSWKVTKRFMSKKRVGKKLGQGAGNI